MATMRCASSFLFSSAANRFPPTFPVRDVRGWRQERTVRCRPTSGRSPRSWPSLKAACRLPTQFTPFSLAFVDPKSGRSFIESSGASRTSNGGGQANGRFAGGNCVSRRGGLRLEEPPVLRMTALVADHIPGEVD